MAFTSGQWGPDTFIDSAGNTVLIGASVTAAGYVCSVSALGNLTVTGPAADAVVLTVTPASGAAYTVSVPVSPLVAELEDVQAAADAALTAAEAVDLAPVTARLDTVEATLPAKADEASLADVATSGDYEDLSNRPTFKTVTNKSGVTIPANALVEMVGSFGVRSTVRIADNSTAVNVAGVAAAEILNNADGEIQLAGDVSGLNTSGVAEGARLYLGSAGGFTDVHPTEDDAVIIVGVAGVIHPSAGTAVFDLPSFPVAAADVAGFDAAAVAAGSSTYPSKVAAAAETIAATWTFTTQPAGIVKASVGLGNVDNTSDAAKPVSTAQQTALDLKTSLDAAGGNALVGHGKAYKAQKADGTPYNLVATTDADGIVVGNSVTEMDVRLYVSGAADVVVDSGGTGLFITGPAILAGDPAFTGGSIVLADEKIVSKGIIKAQTSTGGAYLRLVDQQASGKSWRVGTGAVAAGNFEIQQTTDRATPDVTVRGSDGAVVLKTGAAKLVFGTVGSPTIGQNGNTLDISGGTTGIRLLNQAFDAVNLNIADAGTLTLRSGVKIASGTGTPEGVVTAPVGSTYHRTDGGAGTSFYVKQVGTGNTGWVGK